MHNIYFIVPKPIDAHVLACTVQSIETARPSTDDKLAIVKLPEGTHEIPECLRAFMPLSLEGLDYVIQNNPELWQGEQ